MPNVEKISVALTPEMAALVRDAVKTGEYASGSEVIREALRDWNHKRILRQEEMNQVRSLWEEGLKSGPGRFADIGGVKAEARRRLEDTGNHQTET